MSKIEKIERGYASIYIDREGETLVEENNDFWLKDMISDYYKSSGAIQWNYYLIIPADVLHKAKWAFENPNAPTDDELKKLKNKIISNQTYGRKYILLPENVDRFIKNFFPPFDPEQRQKYGQIVLLKGIDRKDTQIRLRKLWKTVAYNGYKSVDSFLRNYNSMKTLYQLDYLRKELLRDRHMKIIFHTHIRNEHNWSRQKFDFLSPEIITNTSTNISIYSNDIQ